MFSPIVGECFFVLDKSAVLCVNLPRIRFDNTIQVDGTMGKRPFFPIHPSTHKQVGILTIIREMNMIRILLILCAVILILQSLPGCGENSDPAGSGDPATGQLTIYLTDAPSAAFDSVNIIFSEVSAHIDSQWVTVRSDSLLKVNLLDLSNGNTIVFGSAEVPAGKYTQIRIKIADAYVVVDGQAHPLDVPSGAQTGLKLGPQFTVQEGSTYEMVVDFDVNRSIVVMSPVHNPRYKLKPHLRVTALALSGSIYGNVINPEHAPLAYALQGADTLGSGLVDTQSGFFRLSFLPAGSYSVTLEDTSGQSALRENIEVTAGNDQDLGDIVLN